MIKLNDYLVHFLVPDRVTSTKIYHKEFVDILEDGILYRWKLEFKKEERSMMITEKRNVKTSPNCITRDVTAWENVIKEKERKSFATIMVCVTMTQMSATLCKPARSKFSPRTISQNSSVSSRSGLSRTQRGRPKSAA
eukprot:12169945-Ditylum_brightwellii.AAC.1